MKFTSVGIKLVLPLCCLLPCHAVAETDPIVVKGSRFFYQNSGDEFIIKGVTYQPYKKSTVTKPPSDDLLTDKSACQRDISLLKRLNINTIRVFYIDPTEDHSGCLNAFADASIYVLTDLSSDSLWIGSTYSRWTTSVQSQFVSVVDALAPYNNILGLSLGALYSELRQSNLLPFWKAALRDIKAHIKDKNYRDIPIGYETQQTIENETIAELNYLTCDDTKVDFVGLVDIFTDYRDNCTDTASIKNTIDLAKSSHTSIPMFMESWGCRVPSSGKDNRTFHQVNDMYSTSANAVLSGAFVSDYFRDFDEDQDFGLVNLENGNKNATPMDGFSALSSIMATISLSSTRMGDYSVTATAPACPTKGPSTDWNASSILPPTPYDPLCKCMMQSLRCIAKTDGANNPDSDISNAMGANLNTTCAPTALCIGIEAFGSTGQYGAFSACNITELYSWTVNGYWERNGDASCDLNGTATLRAPPAAPNSDCQFLMDQAGTLGEKTLSATLASATSTSLSLSPSPSRSPSESSGLSTGAKGLSTGAKAGLGLGATAIVIALLLGILFVLHRRKQARKTSSFDSDPVVKPELEGSATLDATGSDTAKYRHHSRPVSELPAFNQDPVELPEDYVRGELLGSTTDTERRMNGNART